MKKLFALLSFLLFISCNSQNKPLEIEIKNPGGIGLLEINSHQPLHIYSSKDLDKVYDTVTFDKIYIGNNSGKVEINSSVLKQKLKPYALSASSSSAESKRLINQGLGSYGTVLKFKVIEFNAKYFKVILNENTKEIGYIKIEQSIQKQLEYNSWKDYLQKAQMISVNDKTTVYNRPDGSKINLVDNNCYLKVIDIENEWAEIKSAEGIVGNETCQNIKGWIKWRNSDIIKIRIVTRTLD